VNHGLVVIPKSVNEERILENSEIFFKLDDADMKALDTLDKQIRLVDGGWAPPGW